jgi:hypothetical protein
MRRLTALVFLLAALAAPGAAAAAANGTGEGDALTEALAAGEVTEAEYALGRALSLFRPAQARALYGEVARPGPRDATPILRELAAKLDDLSPADRVLAVRILARPTDARDPLKSYRARARHACDATMCVWWVTKTADAPSLVDRNRNRVPDWIDTTRATFRTVWRAEVGRFGYARPRPDSRGASGRNRPKLDVYVADLGALGIYGYCTSDDPRRSVSRSVSAYCAVDDDFSARQFRGTTGAAALRVTAAHEFFHAIQYGLDWTDDLWLLEGTAAWIEDEVYPSVDDNFQYLRTSPLAREAFYFPLDHDEPDMRRPESALPYGAWIWWRFLSERHGRGLIRDVWNRTRGPAYGIGAVEAALATRGESLGSAFADFGVANVSPAAHYREGSRYVRLSGVGPTPPLARLSSTSPGTGGISVAMPHLSTDMYAFAPGTGLGPASTLRVDVQLGLGVGRSATLVVRRLDGVRQRQPIAPNAAGLGSAAVAFDPAGVHSVTLVLSNGGGRFSACGSDRLPPFFSCHGTALDDATFAFAATATP